MNHDAVVDDWRKNAAARDDANYRFLRSLKMRDDGVVDNVARSLHAEAFQIVDCTRCANCCKTLRAMLNRSDVERIAGYLGMTSDALIEKYLHANGTDEFEVRERPCPFLGEDDRCTIYEIRPEVCRGYPFTNKEGFVFRTMQHADNAQTCPAVFWIIEQMRKRLRSKRRGQS